MFARFAHVNQVLQRLERSSKQRFTGTVLPSVWREHGGALLFYAVMSLVLTAPRSPHFTTHVFGDADVRHNLWLLWHTKEWILGHQPLFDAPYLYYPYGISLLTHGLGPVVGLISLPFWPLGPVVAHNTIILISLCLTGYCMYLLARGLDFERKIALFGGLVLMTAPMCLAGLSGHMTKVFLGGLLPINRSC